MPASIFSETELATLHALRRFLFFAHEGKVQRAVKQISRRIRSSA